MLLFAHKTPSGEEGVLKKLGFNVVCAHNAIDAHRIIVGGGVRRVIICDRLPSGCYDFTDPKWGMVATDSGHSGMAVVRNLPLDMNPKPIIVVLHRMVGKVVSGKRGIAIGDSPDKQVLDLFSKLDKRWRSVVLFRDANISLLEIGRELQQIG